MPVLAGSAPSSLHGAAEVSAASSCAAAAPGLHATLPSLLPALRVFLRRLMRDGDAAVDIAQEAALRALAATNVPTDVCVYRVWLYRIARHAAVDEHRRRRYEEATLASAEILAERAGPDHQLVTRIAVRQALMRLSDDHRAILLLIDVEEFTYAEAARRLRIPVGTVMSRVARARAALLREILQDKAHP